MGYVSTSLNIQRSAVGSLNDSTNEIPSRGITDKEKTFFIRTNHNWYSSRGRFGTLWLIVRLFGFACARLYTFSPNYKRG